MTIITHEITLHISHEMFANFHNQLVKLSSYVLHILEGCVYVSSNVVIVFCIVSVCVSGVLLHSKFCTSCLLSSM